MNVDTVLYNRMLVNRNFLFYFGVLVFVIFFSLSVVARNIQETMLQELKEIRFKVEILEEELFNSENL